MSNEIYTECEKLSKKREQVNELMEFLAFLNKNGVQFGEFRDCINNTPWLNPINLERNGETLAAKFLGIDMDKVEQERLQLERQQMEQDVLRAHSQKAEQLNRRERELDTIQNQAARQQTESSERLKLANHAIRRQHKETMSKLGQRDRLSNEKRLIAEYLKHAGLTLDDEPLDYTKLKQLARSFEKRHSNQKGE